MKKIPKSMAAVLTALPVLLLLALPGNAHGACQSLACAATVADPAAAVTPAAIAEGDVLFVYRLSFIIIFVLLAAVIVALIMLNNYKRRSQRELTAAYDKAKAALADAEKASAAKGSFMSRMSHEIRTPLNAVIGYNTIARNEIAAAQNDADRRQADMRAMDCLTKSEMASKHLLTIINDVLDMSAIESGKISVVHERFDFKSLITSLTSIFYNQAKGKGVKFEVLFDTLAEEWFVGDQMRINQILSNLLSNAIKFTPDGGVVKLMIRQPEPHGELAHMHFEITDTGIGMEREYLEHIWTPFEQADSSISRRFGGSGLGLSITKSLVELMNGSITVTSELGVGSTFAVDIDLERTEQPDNAATYDFSGINALVVDNDSSTCDYVRLLFTRSGARCSTVTSGEEAVSEFSSALGRGDGYTVCMVDWRMPGIDGIETVKRIRNIAGADLPIIIVTAYDFSEIADNTDAAGVNMFVSKPLFQSSLFDLLANVCGGQSADKIARSVKYNFSGARVLLAEDNAMNMEIARNILASVGLLVDCARNGREAVDAFESAPAGAYKAILMDVQMPEMDGHQATRAIRASSHPQALSIPIIAMTADAFAENIAEAIAAGMNDHVAKPIDTQVLFDILSKYIKNGI